MNVARRLVVLGSAFVLAGSLAACSSDTPTSQTTPTTSTSSPAPTGAADVCAARDEVRQSLADVRAVNILQQGTDAFRQSVGALQQDVDALVAAARTEYQPQADALRQSIAALNTALGSLGASPSVAGVASAGAAVLGVSTSFGGLVTATNNACS